MSYDSAVRSWYGDARRWAPHSDPVYKAIDHALLDRVGVEGKDVLDLGCFYPETELLYASRAHGWWAIDFTPAVVVNCVAMQLSHVNFLRMDMRHLEFPNAWFDLVLDFSSGDHLTWDDFDIAVAEVSRVLKPGGTFICTYAKGAGESTAAFGYERLTPPSDMRDLLERRGFDVAHEETDHARSGIVGVKR